MSVNICSVIVEESCYSLIQKNGYTFATVFSNKYVTVFFESDVITNWALVWLLSFMNGFNLEMEICVQTGSLFFFCLFFEQDFFYSTRSKLSKVLYMWFAKFFLAFESRDLSQVDKSVIRVSSFPN